MYKDKLFLKHIIISLCFITTLIAGDGFKFLHGLNNPNGRTGQVTIKMQSIHSMWGQPNKEVFNVTLPITDYVTLEYNTLKFHVVSTTIESDGITTEEWSSMNTFSTLYVHIPLYLIWSTRQ